GGIEPEVYALNEFARDLDFVVLEKDDVLPEIGVAGKLDDFANEALAGLIFGVGFAGDDDLHRHVLVQQDALEAFYVAEQQGGAFVSGKAPGEADGESIRVENFGSAADFGCRGLTAQRRGVLPGAYKVDQAAFAAAMSF